VAVNELDLKVEEGEIFGFLGPNGAGKTTTILMLLGLTEPTAGRASVCGFDPTRQPLEVKRRVGYLPESPGFYEDMSAKENLRYIARLNRIPEEDVHRRVPQLLEQVGLENDGDRAVREFSRGMKQRLGIAEVLIKEPMAVMLDEPTLGIDPDGITRILDIITGLSREHGLTVLLSSHQLHQVQQICSRIGIIVRGKMIVQGELGQLGSTILKGRQWNFLIEVDGQTNGFDGDLRSLYGVAEVERQHRGWLLHCTNDVRPALMALVAKKGLSLLQLRSEDPTLEEIYLKYFREA
jgi:ABC-2 type transport system ATP-binding protein